MADANDCKQYPPSASYWPRPGLQTATGLLAKQEWQEDEDDDQPSNDRAEELATST
jgi:hypothetical protein